MYVTLDGISGAGKSTQCGILMRKFNYKFPRFLALFAAVEAIPSIMSAGSEYATLFANLHTIHCMPPENSIMEDFWRPFTNFRELPESDLSPLVALFRQAIQLNNRPEPDLSIYIHTPQDLAEARRFQRSKRIYTSPSAVKRKKKWEEYDYNLYTMWERIASQVPYFHIVDGRQSVEEITEQIVMLLPENDEL